MSPMSPGSHFISMSYTSGRSMHYVSPLSPGSHQASTPFTFSYFGCSRSPVSHRSHYINHVKIYPFSDILCPQWALGATSYQCLIHLAREPPGKWIDLGVIHILAPMAHRGHGTSEIGKFKGHWSLVALEAQLEHIAHWTARSTWHWYEVAPRAHWGHKSSENG